MTYSKRAEYVGGACLVVASSLMIVMLALHGPIAPELSDQMAGISARGTIWKLLHWTAALALVIYALAGLTILAAASRRTESVRTMAAWAVVPIGALATVVTAVAEATVVADAASSGNLETYATWWAFSEGMANGFVLMALAVALIASDEVLRSDRVTPTWSAWVGTLAGLASASGWALGMWLGIGLGSLLWVVSSITMCIWLFWFGVGMARTGTTESQVSSMVH